jgi:hypothetical protein
VRKESEVKCMLTAEVAAADSDSEDANRAIMNQPSPSKAALHERRARYGRGDTLTELL